VDTLLIELSCEKLQSEARSRYCFRNQTDVQAKTLVSLQSEIIGTVTSKCGKKLENASCLFFLEPFWYKTYT